MKKEYTYLFLMFAMMLVAPHLAWPSACLFSLLCIAVVAYFIISMLLEKSPPRSNTTWITSPDSTGFPINAAIGDVLHDKKTGHVWELAAIKNTDGSDYLAWRLYGSSDIIGEKK